MQAIYITETRAIVPVTRKLAQLRFTIEDLTGYIPSEEEDARLAAGTRGRISTRRIGQLLPNAVLECVKASATFIELNLTFDRIIKIPDFSRLERRYQRVPYTMTSRILWRPETGYCFISDVPRHAVNATAWMLSSAVLGYPGRLSPLDIDRSKMRKIINFITRPTEGGPGELVRAVFRDVAFNGNELDEINIRARDLDKLEIYKDAQKNANSIAAISFVTPVLDDIGRPLACRIDDSGGVLVYSQRLSSESLQAFLLWLESMLAK